MKTRKISNDSAIIGGFGVSGAAPTHPSSFLNMIKMNATINNAGGAGRGSRVASFDFNECFY